MHYLIKQLIGILAPLVVAFGLWSLITSAWDESAVATISDLTIRWITGGF